MVGFSLGLFALSCSHMLACVGDVCAGDEQRKMRMKGSIFKINEETTVQLEPNALRD